MTEQQYMRDLLDAVNLRRDVLDVPRWLMPPGPSRAHYIALRNWVAARMPDRPIGATEGPPGQWIDWDLVETAGGIAAAFGDYDETPGAYRYVLPRLRWGPDLFERESIGRVALSLDTANPATSGAYVQVSADRWDYSDSAAVVRSGGTLSLYLLDAGEPDTLIDSAPWTGHWDDVRTAFADPDPWTHVDLFDAFPRLTCETDAGTVTRFHIHSAYAELRLIVSKMTALVATLTVRTDGSAGAAIGEASWDAAKTAAIADDTAFADSGDTRALADGWNPVTDDYDAGYRRIGELRFEPAPGPGHPDALEEAWAHYRDLDADGDVYFAGSDFGVDRYHPQGITNLPATPDVFAQAGSLDTTGELALSGPAGPGPAEWPTELELSSDNFTVGASLSGAVASLVVQFPWEDET